MTTHGDVFRAALKSRVSVVAILVIALPSRAIPAVAGPVITSGSVALSTTITGGGAGTLTESLSVVGYHNQGQIYHSVTAHYEGYPYPNPTVQRDEATYANPGETLYARITLISAYADASSTNDPLMSASTHAGLHSHGEVSPNHFGGYWGLGYAYYGMSHESRSAAATSAQATATVDFTLVTDVPLGDIRYYTNNFNNQSVLASNLASGTHTLRFTFTETRTPASGYEFQNWTYTSFNVVAYPAPVPEPATYAIALAGLAYGGFSVWRRRKRGNKKRSAVVAASFALAAACLCTTPAHAVTIDMVTVGNPGNANDPTTGYGAVNYEYRIGKYEVTIQQYADFLNAVAATDTYSLYNPNMSAGLYVAGISQSGSSGSYTYSVIGPSGSNPPGANSPGNRPIAFVDWWDAARFTNWMSNGQPTGVQGPTTTENGAYDLLNWSSGTAPAWNAANPNTGSVPLYRIPTENEWYKAAYYKGGGTNAGYWQYATQVTGTAPGNTIGSGANQANCDTGVYSVTQSSSFSESQNYLTNVGAFTGSPSAYGTFDQSGNVSEWNDLTGSAGSQRGFRGGGWDDLRHDVGRASRSESPMSVPYYIGFRLASPAAVPEPSAYAMALAGLAFGSYSLFRQHKRA